MRPEKKKKGAQEAEENGEQFKKISAVKQNWEDEAAKLVTRFPIWSPSFLENFQTQF